jgi:hypothetical protein
MKVAAAQLSNASRGSLPVTIEWGAKCGDCGEHMKPGTKAVLEWDNKQSSQPSRLHTEGQGTTKLRHDPACTKPVVVPTGYKETSQEAFQAALPKLNDLQEAILAMFTQRGAMTDEELFEAFTQTHGAAYRNTVLPARNALYKTGYVTDTGRRRQVKSGRTAIVWAKR